MPVRGILLNKDFFLNESARAMKTFAFAFFVAAMSPVWLAAGALWLAGKFLVWATEWLFHIKLPTG